MLLVQRNVASHSHQPTRSARSQVSCCSAPTPKFATKGLFDYNGLHTPADIRAWTEDVLTHHNQQNGHQHTPSAWGQEQQEQQGQQMQQQPPGDGAALQLALQSVCSVLEFLSECHPDSNWQQAADAALQQLYATAVYQQTAAAAATGNNNTPPEHRSSNTGNFENSRQSKLHHNTAQEATAAVQQLLAQAEQLGDWVIELQGLQAATAAAAAAIQHDPNYSPVLLLDAAAAQQHPLWAREYAAASRSAPDDPSPPPSTATAAAAVESGARGLYNVKQDEAAEAAPPLPYMLPAEQQLHVGSGATLSPQQHYQAAAAAAAVGGSLLNSKTATSSSSSSSADAAGSPGGDIPILPWPLTAAATQVLLCSPLGLLPEVLLFQVYCLGLVGRCRALAEAVDLARLVGAELAAAQDQQQQLGQQLTQQLDHLHRAVQAGVAVDPVTMAAAATAAAAATGQGAAIAAHTAAAVGHPAVAVSFLKDLAAFGKGVAAEEIVSWLNLCRQDPVLKSYLSTSGALQQLPAEVRGLRSHQLASLRETVALAGGGGDAWRAREEEGWLQEYTQLDTLLPGICDVLGTCLQLELQCSTAEPGTTWCKEAYIIRVLQKQHTSSRQTGGSSALQPAQQQLGCIWMLFDEQYHGNPATHMVSPGMPTVTIADIPTGSQMQPAVAGGAPKGRLSTTALADDCLQATTVAVVFPSSFCTESRQLGTSDGSSNDWSGSNSSSGGSGGGSGSSGSSSFSVLQSVLHELGHALHFLLSASGSDAPAAAGGHCSSLEVMETASHLVDRMARNTTCLQAMLRHNVTGQPPPPALIQQLVTYNSISNRGVYQWHQHVLAALTDSRMALAAASQGSAGEGSNAVSQTTSCWDCLLEVTAQYDPLAVGSDVIGGEKVTPVLSTAMLRHLPSMAVLQPGDMYCYICADLMAAALWGRYLQKDPLDPVAWQVLRQGLFEADVGVGPVGIFEGLLGPGSMQELTVSLPQEGGSIAEAGGGDRPVGRSVTGWLPNLAHSSFEDIDLWG